MNLQTFPVNLTDAQVVSATALNIFRSYLLLIKVGECLPNRLETCTVEFIASLCADSEAFKEEMGFGNKEI